MTTLEIFDLMNVLRTKNNKKILKYVDGLAEAYKDNGYHEGYDDGYQAGVDRGAMWGPNDD